MDKTMADKIMYIPNVDTQNYPFCRFQLVVEMIEHLTYWTIQSKLNKATKIGKPTNKKALL